MEVYLTLASIYWNLHTPRLTDSVGENSLPFTMFSMVTELPASIKLGLLALAVKPVFAYLNIPLALPVFIDSLVWSQAQQPRNTTEITAMVMVEVEESQMSMTVERDMVMAEVEGSQMSVNSKVSTRQKRRKGKTAVPEVVTSVRRGLRSDKDGFMPRALPYVVYKRKKSSVEVAPTPEVLQMDTMRKLGVECGVPLDELTQEKLMKPKKA